jgi:glycosyltransferase involved in cell wall biosynthesis
LRVAFAHYSDQGDISGVTTWLMRLARRLRLDDIEVAIHFQVPPEEAEQHTKLTERFRDLRQLGISVSWAPRRPSLAADTRETLAFLNQWQPDVFLPQCKNPHYAAAAEAGRQGLPWVLTLHSDDPDYWLLVKTFGQDDVGASIVSVSEHIQSLLIATGNRQRSWVIPYGVEIPEGTARYRRDPFRVVFSGRIWEHQKRISLVVGSLIRACQTDPAIRATLIGDGYARSWCEQQVQAAGLSETILFTGSVPPEQVLAHLRESQAILLMSDFEGLPVALLEAMATGVVPVVRRIPSGIPELVQHEHTGLLVSEDPEDAARALVRLASDPVLWDHCSSAARERVQARYSAESSYRQWRQLLEALAQGRPAGAPDPYPIGTHRIASLQGVDPILQAPYRRRSVLRAGVRQWLNTSLARAKHRIRGLVRRRP